MLNPVFRREQKQTLRSWRMFISISLYVLGLTAAAGLYLMSVYSNAAWNGFDPKRAAQLYMLLSGFLLGQLMLIVPAVVCGAISGERERQTLDLLLVTKMSTFSIVLGKLFSTMLSTVLLMLAALPVFGIAMFFGSVSIFDVLIMYAYLIGAAVFIGSVSVMFSAIFKKTITAMLFTIFVLGVLSLGTLIGLEFLKIMYRTYMEGKYFSPYIPYFVFSINPFASFVSLADAQMGTFYASGMMGQYMPYAYANLKANQIVDIPNFTLPLWAAGLIANFLFASICVFIASKNVSALKKVKPKKEKKEKQKKEI